MEVLLQANNQLFSIDGILTMTTGLLPRSHEDNIKKYKLAPVPPPLPLVALSITFL